MAEPTTQEIRETHDHVTKNAIPVIPYNTHEHRGILLNRVEELEEELKRPPTALAAQQQAWYIKRNAELEAKLAEIGEYLELREYWDEGDSPEKTDMINDLQAILEKDND